jgi:hypothetical protein
MGRASARLQPLSLEGTPVPSAPGDFQEEGGGRKRRMILLEQVLRLNVVLEHRGAALMRRLKALLGRIASFEMRLRKRSAANRQ